MIFSPSRMAINNNVTKGVSNEKRPANDAGTTLRSLNHRKKHNTILVMQSPIRSDVATGSGIVKPENAKTEKVESAKDTAV